LVDGIVEVGHTCVQNGKKKPAQLVAGRLFVRDAMNRD
jgi:hypothetical protein